MELLSHPLISVAILLGVLVFVHEAGHFLVGKAFGIAVESFSIGFGPSIVSFQKGETRYRVGVLPLGGYVRFYGAIRSEEVPPHLKGREFYNASLFGRICTVAAGPVANFILAIALFAGLVSHGIKQPPALVGQVMPDSPAEAAGLKFGDVIKEIDGVSIHSWKDLSRAIEQALGADLQFTIERGEEQLSVQITPEVVADEELARSKGRIGISPLMVPSIITVTAIDGAAAKAGIKSGWRVIGVGSESGAVRDISFWPELSSFWQEMKNNASGDQEEVINLLVKPLEIDGQDEVKASDPTKEPIDQVKPKLISFSKNIFTSGDSLESSLGISDSQLTISKFEKGFSSVLKPGDRILAWGDTAVSDSIQLSQVIRDNRSKEVPIRYLRGGEVFTDSVSLKALEVQKAEGKVTLYTLPSQFLGALERPDLVTEKFTNPLKAFAYGLSETIYVTKMIWGAVLGLFTGDMPLKALGGPIAIAKVASDSAKLGIQTFLISMAWLSINLGLLNLIPIPVLDGGQLVLLIAEGTIRRPLSESIIEGYQKIGFVMVLSLIVMATYNDLGRFWASILRGMSSMF